MRNRISFFVGALTLTLFLAACEGSPFPISEPGDAEIQEDFLGLWEAVSPDREDVVVLEIYAFNRHEYAAHYREAHPDNEDEAGAGDHDEDGERDGDGEREDGEHDADGDRNEAFWVRAYESSVNGTLWANVQCFSCDDDDNSFLFVHARTDGGELRLSWIDDDRYKDFEDASSPADVLAHFVAHSDDKGFMDEEEVWVFTRV
ncbi:MAG: hypothetical protein ACI9BV_002920, partial [Rhodothermales bacterium]